MDTFETEINELIATRVAGKGDTWKLIEGDTEYPSLTETLEAWFQVNQKKVHFRLEPLNSKLFAIFTETEEIKPEPPKRFNIYGDFD
jgi:hypothetical protein